MSSFILVPFYNTIPKTATSFFTIVDSTLIVSINDVFGNSSKFLTTSINQNIYILNGPNMGTFTIGSLQSTTTKSYTLVITLNSIPPNLVDNTYCVLSLIPSVYTIDRTFTNIGSMDDIGTFRLVDSTTILINKMSLNSDDTIFIYLLITNKFFNIINIDSSIIHVIDNVVFSKKQPYSNYISLYANIPILTLIEGDSYVLNISTDKAVTISNTVINNTTVLPIYNSSVDLVPVQSQPAHTPTRTPSIVTPVHIPHNLIDHSNNINIINNKTQKTLPYNNSAILTYRGNQAFYGNGYFSLNSYLNPDLIDLYSNTPKIEHLKNFSIKEIDYLPEYIKNDPTYNLNNSKPDDNFTTKIVKRGYDKLKTIYSNFYKTVKESGQQLIESQIKADILEDIPIIRGNKYTLSISSIDSFKKQVNFIKQHSLLYLTYGLDIYIIGTTSIPIHKQNGSDSIIECNIRLNFLLPDTPNKSYVLSSYPILPYVTFNYLSKYNIANVINHGCFSVLSISSTNKLPTIVISNFEGLFENDVSSFNNVLYTIIQDPTKKLSPPYLNILNSDYSIVCTLAILHVIPDTNQTTFTYSIISGASNMSTLNDKSSYIITMLSPTDIMSDTGIINTTQNMKPKLLENNNLIQSTNNAINKALLSNPHDHELNFAKNIISDTAIQSTTLTNMPVSRYISQIYDSYLTNTYNAIQHALKSDPNNIDFLFLNDKINNMASPLLTIAKLNNALLHINLELDDNPTDPSVIKVSNYIKNVINIFNAPDSPTVDKNASINTLIYMINQAIDNNPANINLIKARNVLEDTATPSPVVETINMMENIANKYIKTKPIVIEKLENVESNNDNSSYYIIFIIIICIILIGIIINNSKK